MRRLTLFPMFFRHSEKPPSVLMSIPPGREGVRHTLRMMQHLTREGKKNTAIRQKAVELTRYLPQKARLDEIKAVAHFVRDRIRYIKDIDGVETVHTAERVLQNGAGDCDDKSLLLASLLASIGFKTRFVACGFKEVGKFTHVFTEVKYGDKWLPLETTEPVPVGWRPPNIKCAMIANN